ncbi:HAD-IIIA family hydrolase [Actinomadura sp. SCN-SB]|uniref:HAD-IIIA family hydrolase n=1 Tax=Actinomadura sp. SCN-SB TaxID=3373092 RepID=UPI0037526263
MTSRVSYSIVVPTMGRPSLRTLLDALLGPLGGEDAPAPEAIVIVDDRPRPGAPLPLPPSVDGTGDLVRVIRSGGRGPAAARNAGWRTTATEWVVFLDDDVVPSPGWARDLAADLATTASEAGGCQGIVTVPLPASRAATDWERNTAGLESALWITADMAYRRDVLAECGGFDERFRRAYREDADLALRVMDNDHRLVRGTRRVTHPVRPAGFWASVKAQAGNADDVLMRRLHGRDWRERAGERSGRFPRHVATTAAGLLAGAALAAGAHRTALAAGAAWAGLTAEFAMARLPSFRSGAPEEFSGPCRTDLAEGLGGRLPALGRLGALWAGEVAKMLVTSVVIPPAAVLYRLRGLAEHRGAGPWPPRQVVLFDRDDTLIRDVPYNGDPTTVEPMPGAAEALERLRRQGVRIGVVSNQSGVAKGYITTDDVRRVNARVEELVGPIDVWEICPHDRDDDCDCRKPLPALVERAAGRLGVLPSDCVVIGDIGGDVEAAVAAGARGILVPTGRTRLEEIAAASEVAPDLNSAVDLVLGDNRKRERVPAERGVR